MLDSGHSFTAYFKRATSPLVVLSMLSRQPMYGYEISAEMQRQSRGEFTLAVLYPVLHRLEEQDCIRRMDAAVINGRSRTYYEITEYGRQYLAQRLQEYQKLSAVFMEMTNPAAPPEA